MGKFCANCGKELTENAKFCSGCRKPVEVYTEWQQTNKKRYQSKTSIIIFLIILPPVGLYLMWKYANLKKKWKVIITILWVIIIMGKVLTVACDGTVGNEKGSTQETSKYVQKEDLKEKFCNDVGIEYNASDWDSVNQDENTVADVLTYGAYTVSIYYNSDTNYVETSDITMYSAALAANSLNEGIEETISEQFEWQKALIDSMLMCGSDEADSLLREVNKNSYKTKVYDEYAIKKKSLPSSAGSELTIYNTNLSEAE